MGLELSSDAHTLELLYDFILQNEIVISGIAESNTHWEHKRATYKRYASHLHFGKKTKASPQN